VKAPAIPRLDSRQRVALAALALVYAITRAWRLTALPMFFDEAIHLLWAERWSGSQGLARALDDGKLLEVAASGIVLRLVPDPLWAGRFASVLVGSAGLAAAFALGRRVGGVPGGLWAAALAVACPFLLFHERMALADGFVSAFVAIVLVATIRLCDAPRTSRGLALGLALAAAGAAKVIGLVALVYPPVGVALLVRREPRAWRALAVAWSVAALILVVPVRVFLARTGQIGEKVALAENDRLAWWRGTRRSRPVARAYWTPGLVVAGLLATASRSSAAAGSISYSSSPGSSSPSSSLGPPSGTHGTCSSPCPSSHWPRGCSGDARATRTQAPARPPS
jgi:hypothetical protein